jgi:hypothetical protein
VAGCAPLIAGHMDRERLESLLETLDSPMFCGNPDLRWSLTAERQPRGPGFPPAQLLARSNLAGCQLAPVVVA